MWPLSVVIPHQIVADILPSCSQTLIAHRRHPLCFQTPEQALHWRVVPAIASATHALHHAVAPKPLPELAADILRPLIRMEHELLRTSSLLPGMIQGLNNQVRICRIRHRPADHATGTQVQHRSQIAPALASPDIGNVTTPNLIRL